MLPLNHLEDLVNTVDVVLIGSHYVGVPQSEQGPKKHPPPATPLDFPSCTPKGQPPGFFPDDIDLFTLFALPRKLDDINAKHVEILNVNVDRDIPLHLLVPQGYLPPTAWESDPSQSGGSNTFPAPTITPATLSNGFDVPGHEMFYARMKELLFDNDDVFRFMKREPTLPGRSETKVAQFRKFYESIYAMSEYWDTSLDNDTTSPPAQSTPPTNDAMETDPHLPELHAPDPEPTKQPYTGRRIGTGRDMPRQYREDAVRSLVETIAWSFRCQMLPPRNHGKLQLSNLLLPVHQTALVYRPAPDRQRARQGFVEGPLLAIQCRPETSFRQPGAPPGDSPAARLDLLRELGAMLLLAQERARAGKSEAVPGPAQWWATAPRWGGAAAAGPAPTASHSAADKDDVRPALKADDDEAGRGGGAKGRLEEAKRRRLESSRRRADGRAGGAHRGVRAGTASAWDRRTTYARIGRVEGAECDDVSAFLFFSSRLGPSLAGPSSVAPLDRGGHSY